MKLFRIKEPKAFSTVSVGIDLGTTHTLIAVQQGEDVNILGEIGEKLIPSAVYYAADKTPIVGKDALSFLSQDSKNVIRSAKRTIGRNLTDLDQKEFANNLTQIDNQMAYVTQAGIKTPIEVSAEILKKAMQIAQLSLTAPIGGAVITVPAYFDESQRLATKHAAKLAGLPVLRLINEPTAAALAYGLDQNTNGLSLVLDLGGGTFDVTLLKMDKGIFQVLATGGDTTLGGDDMDQKVAQWFFPEQNLKNHDWAQALFQAKQWKEALTSQELVRDRDKSLSRAQFNTMIEPIVHRMLAITQRVLQDADIKVELIEQIILVGGATRTPFVKSQFEQFFNKPLLCSLDPDTVVAEGAARLAASLSGSFQASRSLLLDVLPLSIGIETFGGAVEKILLRNTPIPAIAKETFTTQEDNQTGMILHIVQGERELASENRSLAQFVLKGLPQLPKGHAKVEVTFEMNEENLLRVSATELQSQTSTEIAIKPSYGLTDETINKMLKEAVVHAQEDVRARQLITKQLEGHALFKAIYAATEVDKDLLSEEQRQTLTHALEYLSEALTKNTISDIEVAIHNLEQVSNDFMRQRLDKTLESLIKGKTLPDIASELCPK